MKLYNSLTRRIDHFVPLLDDQTRIYTCGPTVYDHAHIGNLSSYIFADTLRRTLQIGEHQVAHVMNYTDVDDKTIRRSGQAHPDLEPRNALRKLTDQYIDGFLQDMQAVGNDTDAITFTRATDYIPAMQALITDLLKGNFAYLADDGIYFSIDAYKNGGHTYGQLSQIDANNTSEARIANDEYDKESVHDFALWKKQKDGEPAWEYTIDGVDMRGRPGWHIECSAMSQDSLGQPFDIHTGGIDLMFPHHENEIAQSTALTLDKRMVQFFCHNEHLLIDGRKMAKSAGNFYTLQNIIEKGYDPRAFRLLVLQAHYRSQVNFTWESLQAAQNRLLSLQAFADLRYQPIISGDYELHELDYTEFSKHIVKALQDDLATPKALQIIAKLTDERTNAIHQDEVDEFTAFLQLVDQAFGLRLLQSKDIGLDQKHLISKRAAARAAKNWAESDAIRGKLEAQKIGLRDTPHGAIWYRLPNDPA